MSYSRDDTTRLVAILGSAEEVSRTVVVAHLSGDGQRYALKKNDEKTDCR